MTTWAPLRFDPSAPRFDPPNVRPPRDPDVLALCRKIDPLLAASPAEWDEKFSPYFGPDRRRDRRQTICLILKTAITRVDFLEGNVYLDGPKLDKGISIDTLSQLTLCPHDSIKEALGDLKTAQIERFNRVPVEIKRGKLAGRTVVRRQPKSQPRSKKNGKYSAEPAIRNLHLKTIGRVFRCEPLIARLIEKATKRRKKAERQPEPLRRRLMEARRDRDAREWRAKLRKNRMSDLTIASSIVPGVVGELAGNAVAAGAAPAPPDWTPHEQAMLEQIAQARVAIIHEWAREHGRAAVLNLDDAEVDAEARRRVGAPPKRIE